jgi:sugar O-acyltransferase (sialic acid O-acetyltransferase NeuD family)
MKNLIILGAGGFAREVYDLANYCYGHDPHFKVKGFLSDGPSEIENYGYPPVLSTVEGYEIKESDIFIPGIGNVNDRKKVVEIILKKGGVFINLIHPSAVISPSVKIGTGVAIKAFCVLASNVTIGDHSFLQSSAIFGHDVQIGNYCQINSFSFFAGCVKVNDLVTVNAGAKIVQSRLIGKGSTIGIGSIVIKDVPEGVKVFGNPARIVDESRI